MEETLQKEQITIDQKALAALAPHVAGDAKACLRIGVRGGGCAGFQYQLALDEVRDNDLTFESLGQTIVCDPASYPYVAGSEISYRDQGLEQGFEVTNPNAKASCGCGSSFVVDDEANPCG